MVDGLNIKVNMNKKRTLFLIFLLLLILPGLITVAFSQEVIGLKDDLSGNTAPVDKVEVIAVLEGDTLILNDGRKIKESEFSETVSKAEGVLDKLKKIELAKGKIYYDKVKIIEPEMVNDQYCFVKVIIKQKGDTIIKEEILECADGRKKATGPSYWELFAEFYYRDVSAPEYCRYYSRKKHVFKTFGKTCLKTNGEWEVQ